MLEGLQVKPVHNPKYTPTGHVVDLVAWVREVGDLIQFRSKAEKDLKKREIVLADNSKGGSSVKLVLWAGHAGH